MVMKNNEVQRILAVTLALIIGTGIATPAFGDSTPGISPNLLITPKELNMAASDDVIFDNAGATPDPSDGNEMTLWLQTNDFGFTEDAVVTDVHFIIFEFTDSSWDGSLDYWIFEDKAGQPGNILASGQPVNLATTDLGPGPIGPRTEVWFDLEDPFLADAGATYHLGLHANTGNNFVTRDQVYWEKATPGFGNTGIESFGGTMDNWLNNGVEHWFLLTGNPPKVVGGELLPIDATALLVAGAQTNAVWMLSALAVIGSLAFGALYLKTKRD